MLLTIDTKLKLLAGLPIEVENFGKIKPITIQQMIEFGFEKYMKCLNLFCVTKDQFIENPPEELTEFDVLFLLGDENVLELLKEALVFFMQDEVHLFKDSGVIAVGANQKNLKLITRKNFHDIRTIIQLQNYVLSVEDNASIQAKDDRAREIAERMKRAKDQVNKIKSRETGEMETDFFDLLSAISSKSHSINKLDLLQMTVFQIYEEFRRLSHIDQYETNISAMLQGAKNVELKHWSSKI